MVMRDIGKNIYALRTQKNMTQDELAAALFVTRQTVSNYETGRSRPDVEMMMKIAQVLETDPNTLLYGPQVAPAEKSRRPYILLAAGAAVFAVLLAGYFLLLPLVNTLYRFHFLAPPWWMMLSLYRPLLGLSFGWLLLQGLSVLVKFKPLAFSWTRWVRRGILALLAGIALFLLPLAIHAVCCRFILETNNSYSLLLPQWYSLPLMYWVSLCSYAQFLFPLLGGALWLFGFPAEKPAIEPPVEN